MIPALFRIVQESLRSGTIDILPRSAGTSTWYKGTSSAGLGPGADITLQNLIIFYVLWKGGEGEGKGLRGMTVEGEV